MKLSVLLSIGLLSVLTAQAQEAAPDVSTSRSVRQKINTQNFYTSEVVEVPQITFQMGDGETYTATADQVTVKACIKTSKPLAKPAQLFVNGALQQANPDRKLKIETDAKKADCDEPFSQTVQLREGQNKVKLVAQNAGGITDETFLISYTKSAPVVAEKRLALVIGNSAYPSTSRLMNPVNDAEDMTKTLEELGFEVMSYKDLNKKDMRKAVDEFGNRLKGYQVGLFFYAGHGVALADQNYLVPVDASPQTAGDIEFDCLPAGQILAKMDDARIATSIVVLDACRNNPFRSLMASRGGDDRGGLVSMEGVASGSIIAYATSPGKTAADGTGRNGIYTAALLKNLKMPGLPIEEVFKRVRKEVRTQTKEQQQPWELSSLTDDFYFKRK